MKSAEFLPSLLWKTLQQYSTNQSFLIAYSGGLDSHVLLHAMHRLRAEHPEIILTAIHVNHGISASAIEWEKHCQQVCAELEIPLLLKRLAVPSKKNLEAHLRRLRYQAFAEAIAEGNNLLTAHHKNDQAETLLLQLFRGAGVSGLAAMPEAIAFMSGRHVRPLLNYTRAQLQEYARKYALHWIEDESNFSLDYDRNYIRNNLFPLIQQRWPQAIKTITRSAGHCASASHFIAHHSKEKLATIFDENKKTLAIKPLLALSPDEQGYCLRTWLQQLQFSIPNQKTIERIQQELISAREDANPLVQWEDVQVRRYQNALYVFKKLPVIPSNWQVQWNLKRTLALPSQAGTLVAQSIEGSELLTGQLSEVTVRFRREGDRCHPVGRSGSHPLKKLFQEWRVPPWQRDYVPLICIDKKIAAVLGYSLCEGFVTAKNELGFLIEHKPWA